MCNVLNNNGKDRLNYIAKPFSELTAAEIYEILKARSEVFQFEQSLFG